MNPLDFLSEKDINSYYFVSKYVKNQKLNIQENLMLSEKRYLSEG